MAQRKQTPNAGNGLLPLSSSPCSVSLRKAEYKREYARNYYRTNKEKIRARSRELEHANKEKYAETKKAWMAKQDPERMKKLNAARAKRHRAKPEKRESLNATARKYKEANKDKLKSQRQEREIEPANDTYIRHLLGHNKADKIPPELIAIKREHIKLRRALKNL
jgi:hypothetical protein